ncbi:MAG: TRAP transporter substrate-binding protein, partial [Bacillota bacterium]
QKYFTNSRHVYSGGGIEVSEKWWKTLPEADQQIIEEAAKEAGTYQVDLSIQAVTDSLKAMQDAGVQIDELTPEAQAKYKEVALEVWKEFADQFDKGTMDRIINEMGQVQ